MNTQALSRRNFIAAGAATVAVSYAFKDFEAMANESMAENTTGRVRDFAGDFDYKVVRSDDEWRAMLTRKEYKILREGATERSKSSPLWKEKRAGAYHCKGCDQKLYDAEWKKVLNKGWVFFYHSEQNAVLTSIDPTPNYNGNESTKALIEAHCSNCGSHQGHVLKVSGKVLHCINGAALTFYPAESV